MHEAGLRYLLVRVAGEAVATGLLRSAAGAAGIYGITVRRGFQRRGLGTLATLVTVQEGARRGATIAILQATKEGMALTLKTQPFQTPSIGERITEVLSRRLMRTSSLDGESD